MPPRPPPPAPAPPAVEDHRFVGWRARALEAIEPDRFWELLTGVAVVLMISAFPQGAMGFVLMLLRRLRGDAGRQR